MLSCNPASGEFRWRVTPGRRVREGDVAGTIHGGRRRIRIDGRKYSATRLAFLHVTGRWPKVRILLRADSGFARDELMSWCEENEVDYLFGLAKNNRLIQEIETELAAAAAEGQATGKPARRFKDFTYATLGSWRRIRRVVGKAEWVPPSKSQSDKKEGEANPRFVVTSLSSSECEARCLYEELYCARGEMENRIKECQLDLFADRTSAATVRANQLRLYFASMAYVLLCALRRIKIAMASAFPHQKEFSHACNALAKAEC